MKRIAAVLALTGSLLLAPSLAHAATDDPAPQSPAEAAAVQAVPPGAGDRAAARAAASAPGVQRTLGEFFATKGAPPGTDTRAVAPIAVRVTEQTVAVNHLNPAFVAGQSGEVARFAFFATRADAADGRTASIWTSRSRTGGWQVSNIASGDDEQRYASQPGTVFLEPQINAWYALRDGRVVPLSTEATASVGAGGVPLADYQKLVSGRYGDKLPGSAYARNGTAGGYGPGASAGDGGSPPAPGGAPLGWAMSAGVLLVGGSAAWITGWLGGRALRRRTSRT
ncbi:hypothetical protein [Streptosporangium minutum]|uniref:hypothetical protein n=1 Tax=Streptosporangium minutum TaxID=569862 RepID=UPI000A3C3616|nr:hypothetical protein [Streptosporangium minutum]